MIKRPSKFHNRVLAHIMTYPSLQPNELEDRLSKTDSKVIGSLSLALEAAHMARCINYDSVDGWVLTTVGQQRLNLYGSH